MGVVVIAGYSFGTNGHAQGARKTACLAMCSIVSIQQGIGVSSNGH